MSPACSLNCLLSRSNARHGASQKLPQLLQMCAGSEDSSSLWLFALVSHHFLRGEKKFFRLPAYLMCLHFLATQCAALALVFAWANSFREKFFAHQKIGGKPVVLKFSKSYQLEGNRFIWYFGDLNVSFLVKVNSLPVLSHSSVHIFHLTVFLYIFRACHPFYTKICVSVN